MQVRIGRRFRVAVNKSTLKFHGKFLGLHWYTIISMHPKVQTLGLTNMLSDGKFVFFADFDNVFLYRVRKEAMMLQDKFDIGTVAILSTGEDVDDQGKPYGNFHMIGLGKMKYREVLDALDETSCDANFRRVPEYFNGRYFVLRVYPKFNEKWEQVRDRPYLREVIWAKTKRECSLAIYDFLRVWYELDDFPMGFRPRFDNYRSVRILKYQTTESSWSTELKRVVGIDRIKKLGGKK